MNGAAMLSEIYHIVLPDGSWFRFQLFDLLKLVGLPIALIVLRWKGKRAGYLICFALFFIYLWNALYFTLYPFPSGEGWSFAKMIEKFSQVEYWQGWVNLVPGDSLKRIDEHPEQVYGNFWMGAPFGFGLPFVTARPPRRMLTLCFAFGVALELNQVLVGIVLCRRLYRSLDVDDVLLVFAGAACGYGVLRVAAALYRRIGWSSGARVPVWSHFHRVLVEVGGEAASGAGEASRRAGAGEAGNRS